MDPLRERVNRARERKHEWVNGARERVDKCVNKARERCKIVWTEGVNHAAWSVNEPVNDPREQRA